jgi:hypothetical protein
MIVCKKCRTGWKHDVRVNMAEGGLSYDRPPGGWRNCPLCGGDQFSIQLTVPKPATIQIDERWLPYGIPAGSKWPFRLPNPGDTCECGDMAVGYDCDGNPTCYDHAKAADWLETE